MLLVDPTDDEDDLSSGRFSIVMDGEEEICYVHKPGAYFIFVKYKIYESFIILNHFNGIYMISLLLLMILNLI